MDKNYNLSDIGNALWAVIDNPVAKIIRSGAIGTIDILNPAAGVVAGVGDTLLGEYNNYKFSLLLQGLASGLNIEMRLNELYNYVTSIQEKAIIVANLFRKTINAECPKVCIIYGLILANHTKDNTSLTQNELIVCKALENATDYDLDSFEEIMEKYMEDTFSGKRVVFPKDFPLIENYSSTCDWAVYNRIFASHMAQWEDMEEGNLDISTYYYAANPAAVLLEYIKSARQIWNYSYDHD